MHLNNDQFILTSLKAIAILSILLHLGCTEPNGHAIKGSQSESLPMQIDSGQYEKLDSLWNALVFIDGGCLTGGQNLRNGRFGSEACVMTDPRKSKKWNAFFRGHSKKQLTGFLCSKFADSSKTKLHVCPCFNATNGEAAVYALHKLHALNWFDLEEFQSYAIKKTSGCSDSYQVWLKALLAKAESREILKAAWLKELKD